jgi:hypothetical protein
MFTAKDMPTDVYKPIYAKYKDKIYPVNAVHSSWPGIHTDGREGLDQPKMRDIYTMWTEHFTDSSKYPLLKLIIDDNGDEVPEVNKETEIDAVIKSVSQRLADLKYDMSGKQVVWVNNDKVYTDGKNFFVLMKNEYESSPFASVYKYSHNVFPSKSALGINGCTDCHSPGSQFFTASIVKYPFGSDGKPITEMQYYRMELSTFSVYIGIFREGYLKQVFYYLIFIFGVILIITLIIKFFNEDYISGYTFGQIKYFLTFFYIIMFFIVILLYFEKGMLEYILPSRFVLDSNHFLLSVINILISLICIYLLSKIKQKTKLDKLLLKCIFTGLIISVIAGFLMLVQFAAIYEVIKYAYTLFDLSQVLMIICTLITVFKLKINFLSNSKLIKQ